MDLECRGLGEEARRVAVGANAEQDQVEPWNILGLEEFLQLLFVGLRRLIRWQLAPDPVDVRDRNVVQEHLAGHLEVRILVMRGHTPLVPKEDVDFAPVYPVYVMAGQDSLPNLPCRAPCEHSGGTPP